jgi:hypothetical protein
VEQAVQITLLYGVMPIWILAGFADWLCHRHTNIYGTSGPKESLIHLAMLAEATVPLLLCLLLEINALILLIVIGFWILHLFTSHWDIHYAAGRREIMPIEQHIHCYLETMPFMAMVLLFILHWPQLASLGGLGPQAADFSLRWKESPLPVSYTVGLIGVVILFEGLPYLQEFACGIVSRRRRKSDIVTGMR